MPRVRQASSKPFEFAAAVGEDALQRVTRLAEEGDHALSQELRDDASARGPDEDLGQGEGRRGVAGGDLPDGSDAFELSDVEAVETDELAGRLGFDMASRGDRASLLELLPGALCQQAGALGAMGFESAQTFVSGGQSQSPEGSVGRAGSDADPPQRELIRELAWSPGRPRQRQGHDLAFDGGIELGGSSRPTAAERGVEPVGAIARKPLSELVVERAGDARVAARGAHSFQALERGGREAAERRVLCLRGSSDRLRVRVWRQELRRNDPLALFTSGSEVYRPLRHSSP